MRAKDHHIQPWLHSAVTDGVFILLPPFIALLMVLCFPAQFQATAAIPVYYWLILVVFIDVAHVYSTLYRTYLKKNMYRGNSLLVIVPIACYIAGVLLHSYNGLLFWRILAYLAIFHFIRQQYGFMRLYSRRENSKVWLKTIDTIAIYTATIYPLFYWHFAGDRNFSWFIENDVVSHRSPVMLTIGLVIYLLVIFAYIIKELVYYLNSRRFNAPRNFLIIGTFVSWYFGIVYFNGDMAFTTLNVISHGIPYMALIWIFEKRNFNQEATKINPILKLTFNKRLGIVIFILLLIFLAYLEEGLWDGMIWKDHIQLFKLFSYLPHISNEQVLSLLVPLLSLPQSTHYVLDGFIWKMKGANAVH